MITLNNLTKEELKEKLEVVPNLLSSPVPLKYDLAIDLNPQEGKIKIEINLKEG